MSKHTKQVSEQIERYDQLRQEKGDHFADEVLLEFVDLTYTHWLEAELVEDPRIVAIADVGFDGRIEGVRVVTPGEVIVEATEVDPDSGIGDAMEAWLADMRRTWPDGT